MLTFCPEFHLVGLFSSITIGYKTLILFIIAMIISGVPIIGNIDQSEKKRSLSQQVEMV
jgi:hypothetical protein